MLRSILAAVIAGTEPDLKINSEAQSYLQAELALNQAGGQGGVRLRVCSCTAITPGVHGFLWPSATYRVLLLL